jgi:hypothetical protein
VRLLSGEAQEIQMHPTDYLNDLKGKVSLWALNKNHVHDFDLFEIDLVLDGVMLENDMSTLTELGVVSGDELQLIGRLDPPPALANSSDSEPA